MDLGPFHFIRCIQTPQNCLSIFLKGLQRNDATYHRRKWSFDSEAETPSSTVLQNCHTHPLGHSSLSVISEKGEKKTTTICLKLDRFFLLWKFDAGGRKGGTPTGDKQKENKREIQKEESVPPLCCTLVHFYFHFSLFTFHFSLFTFYFSLLLLLQLLVLLLLSFCLLLFYIFHVFICFHMFFAFCTFFAKCEPKNHEELCVQHGQRQHRMEQT